MFLEADGGESQTSPQLYTVLDESTSALQKLSSAEFATSVLFESTRSFVTLANKSSQTRNDRTAKRRGTGRNRIRIILSAQLNRQYR